MNIVIDPRGFRTARNISCRIDLVALLSYRRVYRPVLRKGKVSFEGKRAGQHASMESSHWIIFSDALDLIVRNQSCLKVNAWDSRSKRRRFASSRLPATWERFEK